jgi:hypothetical protein
MGKEKRRKMMQMLLTKRRRMKEEVEDEVGMEKADVVQRMEEEKNRVQSRR